MQTRKPVVAGQFYPGQHYSCVDQINECLDARTLSDSLPETIVAGIVPHAGWTFSGALTALVFSAIRQQHEKVHTFVLFGAAHSYFGQSPALYNRGVWETPLGETIIDDELADTLLSEGAAISDASAHAQEHSIEVPVPFIQYLFAGAKILPILVPPTDKAIDLGRRVGEMIAKDEQKKIICLGSTDLTHYGPRYGFCPEGTGAEAIRWAHQVNDMELINHALKMDAEHIVRESVAKQNACGPAAVATTIAAAKAMGAVHGVLLGHTTSSEVMERKFGESSSESVGYAGIVY